MAYDLTDFHPNVVVDAPGAPTSLITLALLASLTEFCRLSKAWVADIGPLTTIADIRKYTLSPPTNSRVHTILRVTYDDKRLDPSSDELINQDAHNYLDRTGTPKVYVKESGDEVSFYPVPSTTAVNIIQMKAALMPILTATTIDENLADNYSEIIVAGALYRLLQQKSRAWYDPQRAAECKDVYYSGIAEAKSTAQLDHTPKKRVMRYGGL